MTDLREITDQLRSYKATTCHKEGSSSANGVFMMISFLARSAVVVLIGFVADQLGLEKTYLLCAAVGFPGIPLFINYVGKVFKNISRVKFQMIFFETIIGDGLVRLVIQG